MAIEPTPWQSQVLAVPETIDLFLGGGRGGGKSFGLLLLILRHIEQYESNARILFIRRNYRDLLDFEAEARALFRTAYGSGFSFNSNDHLFRFSSGAVLQLDQIEGERNLLKVQGKSYSLIVVDEAGQFPTPEPLDFLRSSLRSTAGIPVRMVLAANPGGAGHAWLYQRHVANVTPWLPYDEAQTGQPFVTAPSTLEDNPHLPTGYRDQLEAATATDLELRRAWVAGDWDVDRGAYFANVWDERRSVIDWDELPAPPDHYSPWQVRTMKTTARTIGRSTVLDWKTFVAIDHGSAAPCVAYFCALSPGARGPDGYYYPKGSLVLFDELAFKQSGTLNVGLQMPIPSMAEAIIYRCREWGMEPAGVIDDATFGRHGGSAGSLADEYKRAGLRLEPAQKGERVAGWEAMRRLLLNAGDAERPGLYISTRCEYLLATLPHASRSRRHPEDLDSDQPDHGLDAARYAVGYQGPPGFHVRQLRGF